MKAKILPAAFTPTAGGTVPRWIWGKFGNIQLFRDTGEALNYGFTPRSTVEDQIKVLSSRH